MPQAYDTFTLIVRAGPVVPADEPAGIRIPDSWESFTWERDSGSTRRFDIPFEYKTGWPRADVFLSPITNEGITTAAARGWK